MALLSREPRIEIRLRLYEANLLGMTADLLEPVEAVGVTLVQDEVMEFDGQAGML